MGAGDDIKAFFVDNIWATILIAVGVVLIIVVLVWYCIRRRRRRGYVSLESSGSTSVQTFLMTETMRKTRDETQAELLNCQYYLRSHPEFELETPLGPIGSRVNKGWFAVTHHGQRKLLYTLPRSTRCCFPFDAPTERTLREMFHILHHPYVLPIHHVGFISGQDMAVVVLPFAMKGSLKDVIHHSNPLQVWDRKYTRLRPPLPLKQIALIGRQVLEVKHTWTPRPRKRRVSRETSFSTSSVTATPRKAAPAASTASTQQATPSRPPQQQQPQQQQAQQPQPQQRPQQQQVQKQQRPASSEGRGALLSSIRQGKSLRKAKTNDRSAPRV
ncbi:hypothetical protein PTSG_00066 [Salpingoeca rosetta]|uniref:WH2 domain-containing protein n=1 Tax=Salpingoeca rosetta (strain ATCC 50818 / BSB-021) TaxID=946362 RepID=F2TVF4_SALR5|nr:uncharacterized protein PTSG_00066 [Salpingoeca rosetta]EGD72050.1 hypothetical protein PTSG_00066 [Salpingoeca rosetta]|eukprot:XP_004998622.1 hypothetical protein PTSG_00066 [Salpingoeca rosetta]